MSDTPRTEAMVDSCGDYEKSYHYNGRFADFARTLEREIAALRAENERLREDAERYRYIRNDMPRPETGQPVWMRIGDDLDEAIDAAIDAARKEDR